MAVNLLGGHVEYANFWTSPLSFYECMKLFGDNHPSIQGCLKATFAKEGQTSLHNNYTGSSFTTPSFFNWFSMGWYVTDETHVLGTNGEVFLGIEEIRRNKTHLPSLLHLHRTEGQHKWVLIAESASFFVDEKYKICHFE